MTTTEWMERYNRAFDRAAAMADLEVMKIDGIPESAYPENDELVRRMVARAVAAPGSWDASKLPPELLPPGYVELGHGLRVEWDEQNKKYKLHDEAP